jgi:hypothetical protein
LNQRPAGEHPDQVPIVVYDGEHAGVVVGHDLGRELAARRDMHARRMVARDL